MTALAHTSRVSQVLQLMPRGILAALDAWSYRVALKHAEQRRQLITARQARAAAVIAQYKLEPIKD
jgi:hypothetical protein